MDIGFRRPCLSLWLKRWSFSEDVCVKVEVIRRNLVAVLCLSHFCDQDGFPHLKIDSSLSLCGSKVSIYGFKHSNLIVELKSLSQLENTICFFFSFHLRMLCENLKSISTAGLDRPRPGVVGGVLANARLGFYSWSPVRLSLLNELHGPTTCSKGQMHLVQNAIKGALVH